MDEFEAWRRAAHVDTLAAIEAFESCVDVADADRGATGDRRARVRAGREIRCFNCAINRYVLRSQDEQKIGSVGNGRYGMANYTGAKPTRMTVRVLQNPAVLLWFYMPMQPAPRESGSLDVRQETVEELLIRLAALIEEALAVVEADGVGPAFYSVVSKARTTHNAIQRMLVSMRDKAPDDGLRRLLTMGIAVGFLERVVATSSSVLH
jgi:hypothetical protein